MAHHAKKLIHCKEVNGQEAAIRATDVAAIVQKGEVCTIFLNSGQAFDLDCCFAEVCALVREHG